MKRALIIILIALLACGCSAHVTTRTAVAAKPDTSRFLIGAAATSEAQFQQATGVQPDIVEHYARTGTAFSASFAAGAIPLIQLMPYDVSLASIANGDEDDWLRSYARAVAGYQRPVILGFAPEMNGSWYTWGDTHVSPAGYIAAWRHVVTVFRGQGALNVTWLWTVNVAIIASGSSPSNGVGAATPWWPGAAWVDWAGVDGYFYRSSETLRHRVRQHSQPDPRPHAEAGADLGDRGRARRGKGRQDPWPVRRRLRGGNGRARLVRPARQPRLAARRGPGGTRRLPRGSRAVPQPGPSAHPVSHRHGPSPPTASPTGTGSKPARTVSHRHAESSPPPPPTGGRSSLRTPLAGLPSPACPFHPVCPGCTAAGPMIM